MSGSDTSGKIPLSISLVYLQFVNNNQQNQFHCNIDYGFCSMSTQFTL